MACTCVYATDENTKAVRAGYEMGGYVLKRCDECLLEDAKELDEAYASVDSGEAYDRDLMSLVQAVRVLVNLHDNPMHVQDRVREPLATLSAALDQFEPWLEQDDDPRSMGWVDDKGRP